MADQVTPIIRKAFYDVKPGRSADAQRRPPVVLGGTIPLATEPLNAEIAGLDLIVSAQILGLGGVDHLAFAHHVHIVD
jgi:hypothetical protein